MYSLCQRLSLDKVPCRSAYHLCESRLGFHLVNQFIAPWGGGQINIKGMKVL